ncbi:hypothetical protein BJX64DRAFT_291113 [Aspergillus heterothallicus]
MDSNPKNQEVSKVQNSNMADCDKNILAHFTPAKEKLQLMLEFSRSIAAVIQDDQSLARHFNVPLASDNMAGKIDPLFGELQLVKDDEGEVDNDIHWIDILFAPTYAPTRREDGHFYLRLDGRRGWIKISESDHNFIESGLPQKLINPRSYPSDLHAEQATMGLVESLLLDLNKLASQIINTNNDSCKRITKRLEDLRRLRCNFQDSQAIAQNLNNADIEVTASARLTRTKGAKKRKGTSSMPPWKLDELDRLPQWFRDHKHLTKKQVETQFETDFGRFRTYGAIVTAHYRAQDVSRKIGGGTKRKLREDPSPPLTEADSARVPTCNITERDLRAANSPPSVPFFTALAARPTPNIPSSDTTESLSTESQQNMRIEAQTDGETVEESQRTESLTLNNSRAAVESSEETGINTLYSPTDPIPSGDKSSGTSYLPTCLGSDKALQMDRSDDIAPGAYFRAQHVAQGNCAPQDNRAPVEFAFSLDR